MFCLLSVCVLWGYVSKVCVAYAALVAVNEGVIKNYASCRTMKYFDIEIISVDDIDASLRCTRISRRLPSGQEGMVQSGKELILVPFDSIRGFVQVVPVISLNGILMV